MAVAVTSTPAAVTVSYRWLSRLSLCRARTHGHGEWHAAPAAGTSAQAGVGTAGPHCRATGLEPGDRLHRRRGVEPEVRHHSGHDRVRCGRRGGRRANGEPPRMVV